MVHGLFCSCVSATFHRQMEELIRRSGRDPAERCHSVPYCLDTRLRPPDENHISCRVSNWISSKLPFRTFRPVSAYSVLGFQVFVWLYHCVMLCYSILCDVTLYNVGPGVALWLRHCATSRTVPGSIPGSVTGDFFPWYPRQNHVPWGRLSLWKWVPGISPGVKAAGAYGWRPTTLIVPNVKKIRGLNLPFGHLSLLRDDLYLLLCVMWCYGVLCWQLRKIISCYMFVE